jgi:uroporphyrinogen decarboxylase
VSDSISPRDLVRSTIEFQSPGRRPRDPWILPSVVTDQSEVVRQFLADFRPDFTSVTGGTYGVSKYHHELGVSRGTYPGTWGFHSMRVPLSNSSFLDSWGCVWEVSQPGTIGEVKKPILDDWSEMDSWEPPSELLNEADLSEVNDTVAATDLFVRVGTEVRPFERMQFLRGTANVLMDMAYGDERLTRLRDMLHNFYCRELEMWCNTDVDGLAFMDDWGSQDRLLISPEVWRTFLKPLYRDYIDIIHGAGKYALLHTDGQIMQIFPDLVEIGVDVINSQLFCMDIEEIGRQFKGKITFWGEIDRQQILPSSDPMRAREAVRRINRSLESDGGVIAQCEWGSDVPEENMRAVFEEWNDRRH